MAAEVVALACEGLNEAPRQEQRTSDDSAGEQCPGLSRSAVSGCGQFWHCPLLSWLAPVWCRSQETSGQPSPSGHRGLILGR